MSAKKAVCCIPCLHPDVKDILRAALDEDVHEMVDGFADCPVGTLIDSCYIERSQEKAKKPRTEYQEFVSVCMKGKNIKGFGEAPKAMKECAADWRRQKGK